VQTADHVLIEVHDVSFADAPSTVVAKKKLERVPLSPNGRIRFALPVPEVDVARTLALQVHVSSKGSERVSPGDLLTTTAYPLPNNGEPPPLEVRVATV
jgi:putative lipoprotein